LKLPVIRNTYKQSIGHLDFDRGLPDERVVL